MPEGAVSKTVFATPGMASFPAVCDEGKPMLHFCPLCNQHYECEPVPKVLLSSMPFLYGKKSGTPHEWRCPECAKKLSMLVGERLPAVIRFVYTQPAA